MTRTKKNKVTRTKHKVVTLSKRETQVLALLADGHTTDQIAAKFFLSSTTIDTHRRNIINKLKVNNITEAVAWGLRKGYIK